MKTETYIVHLGKSNKRFELQGNSLDEISMLIAAEMPEEWYGMSIQKKTLPGESPTFMCNAVKDYYDAVGDHKTPLEITTLHMLSRVRLNQPELLHWTWDAEERDEVRTAYTLVEGLKRNLIKEVKD